MTAEASLFDPYAPGFDADPGATYRRLLTEAPVHWWARGQAFVVSKHADVVALQKDPRFTRSPRAAAGYQAPPDTPEFADFREASDNSLFFAGPADHLRQRRLVAAAFSPKALERMREETREITRQALASLPDDDVVNLAAVADAIPLRVIGRMIDIPADREAAFLTFAKARVALISPVLPPDVRERLMHVAAAGYTDLRALIAERRERPGTDLLSTLIHHEEEGTRLREVELLGMVGAIVIAGSDTTVHTLRFLLLDLIQRPELLARVRREPTLIRTVMEESLRENNFNRLAAPMWALEDVTIRGVQVAAGQMVFGLTAAASRDPEVFVRPDEFDVDRPDLAETRNFGAGPHTCLGVHLARIEVEAALPVILERYPTMTLEEPPVYARNMFFRSIDRLMVRVRGSA